ncbi:MAG: CBS domain-containing protein [Anaerolineales bacterium]|nr:CBS domain-containing protein [Anaerolineales bacterium]
MINEKVMDWMSRTVLTINADQTLPEAHALMKEYNVRRLPVLEQGRLVGIVTLGDLREASPSDATSLSIFELNYLLARLTMQDIMTRDPLTVAPNTRLAEAAKLMLHHKVGGLPVMEDGSLVGIITETDIFRAYVHLAEEPAGEVTA